MGACHAGVAFPPSGLHGIGSSGGERMKKRTLCILLSGVVSICCLICLISAAVSIQEAVSSGGSIPMGPVLLTVVTGLCAGILWKGVRDL